LRAIRNSFSGGNMSDLEKEKFYEEFNREQGNPNNVKMFNLAKRSPKY